MLTSNYFDDCRIRLSAITRLEYTHNMIKCSQNRGKTPHALRHLKEIRCVSMWSKSWQNATLTIRTESNYIPHAHAHPDRAGRPIRLWWLAPARSKWRSRVVQRFSDRMADGSGVAQ